MSIYTTINWSTITSIELICSIMIEKSFTKVLSIENKNMPNMDIASKNVFYAKYKGWQFSKAWASNTLLSWTNF